MVSFSSIPVGQLININVYQAFFVLLGQRVFPLCEF